MRYMIYFQYERDLNKRVSYTPYYDFENHFNPLAGMIIFDLQEHKYTIDGNTWYEIQEDHL